MYLLPFLLAICVVLSRIATSHASLSPHQLGLRPAPPLEDMPPPDLIESSNKSYDPKPRDLNVTILKAKLGAKFDPEFMRVTKPRLHQVGQSLFRRNRHGKLVPLGEMPPAMKHLNLGHIELPDGSRHNTGLGSKLRRKLQRFLWAFTSCPVSWKWRDLGPRFWPRFIREGHCLTGRNSCSIPPGMMCRPVAKVHKTLLRFHCNSQHRNLLYTASTSTADVNIGLATSSVATSSNHPHNNHHHHHHNHHHHNHCQWINVGFPIITECSCSCPSSNNQ